MHGGPQASKLIAECLCGENTTDISATMVAMSTPRPTLEQLPLRAALDNAMPKPDERTGKQADKKNYAERLSREIARLLADRLRAHFPRARVTPYEDGTGQEFRVGNGLDRKKTDVGVWDDAAGLILGGSIKTYSFRDYVSRTDQLGRMVKNVKRNDMELRDEADVLHRRQPYAVLYALFFQPRSASWDGVQDKSSFAHAVFTFRKRQGRDDADSPRYDKFERIFIGLYEEDGPRRGHVEFFDVARSPRKNQPPDGLTIDLEQLVSEMVRSVRVRNGLADDEERYSADIVWSRPEAPAVQIHSESLQQSDVLGGGARID